MLICRPKKKRITSATKDDGARVSRSTMSVRCSEYGNVGHNGRSCKGLSVGISHARGSGVGHNAGFVNKGKSPLV